MSVKELVERLLYKVDHYLNAYAYSNIGEACLKGEKAILLMIKEFIETGEIPDMLKE